LINNSGFGSYHFSTACKDIFGSFTLREAVSLFCKWSGSVSSRQIKEMFKIAEMFNRHLAGVCHALVETFSNAMTERLNGKIQEVKSRARGYKTFKNFRSAILFFHCGLQLYPLNPQYNHLGYTSVY
jgi:transposase